MFTLRRMWKRATAHRQLLAEMGGVGPCARSWSERQSAAEFSVATLCALGKSAIDEIPESEVIGVTSLLLRAIQRLGPRATAGLLAGAGLALSSGPRMFSPVRNLHRIFLEIERVPDRAAPVAVLARLGNQLPVPDARVLLAYMAGLSQLDSKSRQLAREATEADAPHPKLIFRALLGGLPETLSGQCSPALRNDLLVLQLMTQERPSFWERLGWAFRGIAPALR